MVMAASEASLPDKCIVRDWQLRWQQANNAPLRYEGYYAYTAADDVVDSEALESLSADTASDDILVEAHVAISVAPTGMGFMLSGHVAAVVPVLHPHTLEAIETPLDFDVTERFLITDNLPKEYHEEEWLAQYGDESDAYGQSEWVDLRDWVRQWLVLKSGEVNLADDDTD